MLSLFSLSVKKGKELYRRYWNLHIVQIRSRSFVKARKCNAHVGFGMILGVFLVASIFFGLGSSPSFAKGNFDVFFGASVKNVNISGLPYTVLVEIDNKIDLEIDYKLNLYYKGSNELISSKEVSCFSICDVELTIDKIYLDEYYVIIENKRSRKNLKKRLDFDLRDIGKKEDKLSLEEVFYYRFGDVGINLSAKLEVGTPQDVYVDLFNPRISKTYDTLSLFCDLECDINYFMSKDILFDEYIFRVKLRNKVFEEKFRVEFDNSEKEFGINDSSYGVDDSEIVDELDIDSIKGSFEVVDLFGNVKTISDKSKLRENSEFVGVRTASSKGVKVKPVVKNLNSFDEVEDLELREVPKVEKLALGDISGLSTNFASRTLNSVVSEEENILYSNSQFFRNLNVDSNPDLNIPKRKLVPGVYKKQRITTYKDGTQDIIEEYFTNGLISINTLKPLYHQNEKVDMLIVVLDKWGRLVSNADIILNITKPDGTVISFDTDSNDIIETYKAGVYSVSTTSDLLGEYSLFAQVELNDMIVHVDSYFNSVESYPYDIIRDVPATIDPWEGPYTNNFMISPLYENLGNYNFTELFSSDIEVLETDADLVETINDTTYLTWFNLSGDSILTYNAQVPLVTPYLYYLGESYVDYGTDSRFFENRSWLFAIDPAAKECGSSSPCICGAACAGGGESGDGTIDACGDGNVDYEFVNDVRVTDLNGSTFGTGNTVQICVDFDCDNFGSGDRVVIGYKDGSSGWVNGDVIFEAQCDTSNVVTHCVNQTLSNFVGTHHVRGKISYQFTSSPANDICFEPTYYDHDDLAFEVLERVPATQLQWNLDNGTSVGDAINVTRGNNLTIFTEWDKTIISSKVRHDGSGSATNYTVSAPFTSNYTNYTAQTMDLTEFNTLGVINVSYMSSVENLFSLENKTSPARSFNLFASIKINQSVLEPFIIFETNQTTMSCQASDSNVSVAYPNVNISFYHNVSGYLGSNLTNSTGWANFNFSESSIGDYEITCNFTDQVSDFYLASNNNFATKPLSVKANGQDINAPDVINITANPNPVSTGGVVKFRANITDDINLVNTTINITDPLGSSIQVPLLASSVDYFEYNYTDTNTDGLYYYFIIAKDNSSNTRITTTSSFRAVGLRTFIGVETNKNVYKIGERINLTLSQVVSHSNLTSSSEEGDSGSIYYNFDTSDEEWTSSGTANEWARGNDTTGFVRCDGTCFGTDLSGDYNANSNQILESPVINFSGRTNLEVNFWRMLEVDNGLGNDRAFFEGFDGSSYLTYFQDTTSLDDPFILSSGTSSFFPVELEGVDDAQFRFRLTSNGGTHFEGWAMDNFSISFDPREDWDKDPIHYDSNFGTDNNKTIGIKISINITGYNSSGSVGNLNSEPDLLVDVFNGASYAGNHNCNLDSSLSYPHTCEIIIKNDASFLDAWRDDANRSIRITALDLDNGDAINWTNVTRTYYTPSRIENHGIVQVNSRLLQTLRNESGSTLYVVNNETISIDPNDGAQLNDYFDFIVPSNITMGNYTLYSALTDSNGNVLTNADDSSYVNDTYDFSVESLQINVLNPLQDSNQILNFTANLSLDLSYVASGGWCGFSVDGAANVTMLNDSATVFYENVTNILQDQHSIIFYCNDSSGYMVSSNYINFTNFQTSTDINIDKTIREISTNLYRVSIDVHNNLTRDYNYTLHDFVNGLFVAAGFSTTPNNTELIPGGFYNGTLYSWNLTMLTGETRNIQYSILGQNDYELSKNYVTIFE